MPNQQPSDEFEKRARDIIDGQHVTARSDGKGGWIKVEEFGVYLQDEGINEVVAELTTAHQTAVAQEVVSVLKRLKKEQHGPDRCHTYCSHAIDRLITNYQIKAGSK